MWGVNVDGFEGRVVPPGCANGDIKASTLNAGSAEDPCGFTRQRAPPSKRTEIPSIQDPFDWAVAATDGPCSQGFKNVQGVNQFSKAAVRKTSTSSGWKVRQRGGPSGCLGQDGEMTFGALCLDLIFSLSLAISPRFFLHQVCISMVKIETTENRTIRYPVTTHRCRCETRTRLSTPPSFSTSAQEKLSFPSQASVLRYCIPLR